MEGNRICKIGHTFIKQFASSVYHERFISVNQLYHRNDISLKSTDRVVTTIKSSLFENGIKKSTFININKICLEDFFKENSCYACKTMLVKIWVFYKMTIKTL